MALPILAKGITSALVKKGKSAKKDDIPKQQKDVTKKLSMI